jgi:hypothetical protein
MIFKIHDSVNHEGEPTTDREWLLSDEIDDLFIADAEKVCLEQSNRNYSIKREDVIRLIQHYGDLSIERVLAVLNKQSSFWTNI